MHQQIKDKLHYYSRSGLKVETWWHHGAVKMVGKAENVIYVLTKSRVDDIKDDECNVYMRPLSSLTKPITVPGYNDGKPFVPSTELSNIYGIDRLMYDKNKEDLELKGMFTDDEGRCYAVSLPLSAYELLFRWHFWLWDQQLFSSRDIIEIKD